ncbi:hypothetical protein PIB30_062203 [Stylosanthes scabra]|uniref:Uncharacterized protein n=1 Tax=Stylosanthes scabra TaxID=79078 RepID=A0ABU6VN12_9FABA|nr:hypothetical protein [Stylosanthes scabra]
MGDDARVEQIRVCQSMWFFASPIQLAKDGREFEEKTKQHINENADAGLRTLILAYPEIDEDEYNQLNKVLMEAKNLVAECIDKLPQAGITLWVLNGDKMETVINIG